jgi:hypothetical protein
VLTGGIFGTDAVSGQATQTFDTPTIGVDKVLTASMGTLAIVDGNNGNNYKITLASALGEITTPATPGGVGDAINGGNQTTPININLAGLGDLLAGLEPTAAGEEEDPKKIKAKARKDGSPVEVQSGGVNTPPTMH